MPVGYRHTTKSVLTPDELAKADREVLVYGATQTNTTCLLSPSVGALFLGGL